jgi:hypothetical protein
MAKARAKRRPIGAGCLFLFALPFAAVGVGMAWWSWRTVARYEAMQSWVEVPAIIQQADLKTHHRVGKRGRRSTSYRTVAKYEYEFNGRRYVGDRVSFYGGSDNLGSFQFNVHRELKRHLVQKKPFRCFVNPQRPSEAVLYRQLRWEVAAFQTVFATVFGSVGFGMLTGALILAWRLPKTQPTKDSEDQPWLSRSDWTTGKIAASGGVALAAPILGVLVIWWTTASLPLLMKLPEIFYTRSSPWVVTTLAFPAVGAVLFLAFVYQFVRRLKFGKSVLQLATTPGVVGGQLAGVIRIPITVLPIEGFRLTLICIEKSTRGKNETSEEMLWQEERIVTEPLRARAGGAIAVPVLFAIPYEAQETSRAMSNRRIEWRLEASAEMPGVDYKSRFEVPVFKTPESRANFQLDEQLAAEFAAAPRRDLLLRGAGILKEPLPGNGVRLVFPAARNLEVALPLTVITALWSSAIWLMLHLGVPMVIPIVFGLIDLLLIWIIVDLSLHRSVVEARSDGVTIRRGLLGLGRKRYFTADEVKLFTSSHSMSVGAKVWNNIVLVARGGKERTVAHTIEGRLAQQAAIDELNGALRISVENVSRRGAGHAENKDE